MLKVVRGHLRRSWRFYCSGRDEALAECGWKHIIEGAACVKEADKLDICEPQKLGLVSVNEKEAVHLLNGVPEEYRKQHKAIITKRPKNVMQQGSHNTKAWEMAFETKQRWQNPVMGWASSGDSHSNFLLRFPSSEAAIRYAERFRIPWEITTAKKPQPKAIKPKSYAENFSFKKRTRVSTK